MQSMIRCAMTATAMLACTAMTAEAGDKYKKQPNFIVILADDLGQDATSLYNAQTGSPADEFPLNAPLPNLADLAGKGILFENGWAMTQCTATRGARSMGLLPSTTGMGSVIAAGAPRVGLAGPFEGVEFPPLMINPADGRQIQQLMQQAGYETFKLGKWHETASGEGLTQAPTTLIPDTQAAGFDEFVGYAIGFPPGGYGGSPGATDATGAVIADQSYEMANSLVEAGDSTFAREGVARTAEFLTSYLVGEAIKMIDENKSTGKPYYMAFDFSAPHWVTTPGGLIEGWEVPPGPGEPAPAGVTDWRTLTEEVHGGSGGVLEQVRAAWAQDNEGFTNNFGGAYPPAGTESGSGVDPVSVARKRAGNKALIAYMDVQIDRLLEHVDLDNTYMMFIGDNGTSGVGFAGPAFDVIEPPFSGLKSKGTLYRNGVEVPFLVAGPKVKKRKRPSKELVNVLDVLATVTDLADVKQPRETRRESISFKRVLKGGKSKRKFNIAERFSATPSAGGPAVVTGAISGNDGRVIADKRFRLIAKPLLDNGAFVCDAGYPGNSDPNFQALLEAECLTDDGVYMKQHTMEFYDLKNDPLEVDGLTMDEMSNKQRREFRKFCREMNRISRRATYNMNGNICERDGSQLIDPPGDDPAPVLVASAN